MALTLPSLLAMVVAAMGGVARTPSPRWVDAVVGRAVNATAETMAARRGLRLARPIAVRVVGRSQMNAARDALLLASRGGDGARDEATLYERLGLGVPARPEGERAGGPREVSGLFDVASGKLLVANWIDWETGRFALARDVAQVLLDRRFDLERWLAPPRGRPAGHANIDALLARQALITGDATAQALEFIDPQGAIPSPRALAHVMSDVRAAIVAESPGAPPLLLGRRLFAELDGLAFVVQTRSRSPWSAIDGMWQRPPQSSEQILHPEKYDRSEKPDDVAARLPPRPPRGAWRPVYRDTLGELGVRMFLARAVDEYRAERAATGWGGDCALLFAPAAAPAAASSASPVAGDTLPFAAWITTWDDDTDAEDFTTQAASVLGVLARAPVSGERGSPTPGRLRAVDSTGRAYVIERRRRVVGMLFAAPAPADADGVLRELMSAAATGPARRAPSAQVRVRSR